MEENIFPKSTCDRGGPKNKMSLNVKALDKRGKDSMLKGGFLIGPDKGKSPVTEKRDSLGAFLVL